MKHIYTPHRGFTLIELSIVLVVIALLVGGTLAGQSLIRAAELRSVPTDTKKFSAAALTFRDKYHYLPGDMPNATTFWGAQAICDDLAVTSTPTTLTCNGNGDGGFHTVYSGAGVIGPGLYSGSWEERLYFWQHLANAGFIEGAYTGTEVTCSANCDYIDKIGYSVPASKMSGGGYDIQYVSFMGYDTVVPSKASPKQHWFGLGGVAEKAPSALWRDIAGNTSFAMSSGPKIALVGVTNILTPADAQSIDTKMDDGNPDKGRVIAPFGMGTSWSDPPCATSTDHIHAEYNLSNPNIACNLKFWAGF